MTSGKTDRRTGAGDDARVMLELLCAEARAPLDGILAMGARLARQPLPADAHAHVRTIVETAEALLKRFDRAREFASGAGKILEFKAEPTELRCVMDHVQERWQSKAGPGVTLLVSYDGDPQLACMADPARLEQLFDSLVSSALRVTPRGVVEASLRARTCAEGVELQGRVRDAGPPLSAAAFSSLFDASAASAGPDGLSLPIGRELVQAMGGSIRAERNVGPGVTVAFRCTAPAVEAQVQAASTGTSHVAHVLVVDDNATNRMVAQSLCEMFDCTSEAVEDGLEAVEAARSGRFDVILMDIKMPRMDGIQATRAIRALPGGAGRAPIIALTANADPDDVAAYLACGMCDVVEKPIKPERLMQAMNAALEGEPAAQAKTRAA